MTDQDRSHVQICAVVQNLCTDFAPSFNQTLRYGRLKESSLHLALMAYGDCISRVIDFSKETVLSKGEIIHTREKKTNKIVAIRYNTSPMTHFWRKN